MFIAVLGAGFKLVLWWGAFVVAAPWHLSRHVADKARKAMHGVVYAPYAGWMVWQVATLLGTALGAGLAYWLHMELVRPLLQGPGLGWPPAPSPPSSGDLVGRFHAYEPGMPGTSLSDGIAALMCVLTFLPSVGMFVAMARGMYGLASEEQIRRTARYITYVVLIAAGVHVVLCYTALGRGIVVGLSARLNPLVYVGVVIGIQAGGWFLRRAHH